MTTARLIQIIRNSFIRLVGLFDQFLGVFRKLLSWLNQGFNLLKQLLGFTESQDFLEEQVQGAKAALAEEDIPVDAPKYSPPAASSTRRRPDASMDNFRKLAAQVKTSR